MSKPIEIHMPNKTDQSKIWIEISEKIREAAKIAMKNGMLGTHQWLEAVADQMVQTPMIEPFVNLTIESRLHGDNGD